MTCLPTTHDGFMWAVGHFIGDQVFTKTREQAVARQAWFDANPGKTMPNPYAAQSKAASKTSADAIALVVARVNARKG